MLKRYDSHLIAEGPNEYISILRPTPEGKEIHQTPIGKHDPFPEHIVFLTAKGLPIVDWAAENLPAVAAQRVKEFVRTRNPRALATLTELELKKLCEQNEELSTRLKL